MNELPPPVPQIIEKVQEVHDYVQLYLKSGGILNLNGPSSISGAKDNTLASLAGGAIVYIETHDAVISIRLQDGRSLTLELKGVRGAEAMVYHEGKKVVVWNT